MTPLRFAALRRMLDAGPHVWVTVFCHPGDGTESLGDVYVTERGAQAEVDFLRACGYSGPRIPQIRKLHLHSDELAMARWDIERET